MKDHNATPSHPLTAASEQWALNKRKYVEYEGTTAREMYYLGVDPYELTNKPQNPPAGLVSRLQTLKNCSGATCRVAEEGQ